MKKVLCWTAVFILGAGVLHGCSAKKQPSQRKVTSRQENISQVSKAQKIEIISLEDQKTIAVVKNKDNIRSLMEKLKIDEWKAVKEIPEDEISLYQCDLYQAGTKKLMKDTKTSMKKMGSLTFYRDSPYVSAKILDFRQNFKMTADAEEILNKL